MAQFELFRNPRGGVYPVLLDVQTDLLSQLSTRLVVPLTRRGQYQVAPIAGVGPIASIAGVEYVLVFPLLAAIPRASLGKSIGSLAARRPELIAALDLVFTGS